MKKFSLLLVAIFSSQQIKLNNLKTEFLEKTNKADTEINSAKQALRDTMGQENVDESKVSSLMDKISNLEKDKLKAKYSFIKAAKEIKTSRN